MSLQSSNLVRIFDTDKAGTGAGLTQGFYADGVFPVIVGGLENIIQLGSDTGPRDRSIQLRRLYTNALNNLTLNVDLHTVELTSRRIGEGVRTGMEYTKIGRLVLTASTLVGDGAFVPSTHRYADTVTWTATAYGTHLFTSLGVDIQLYSPADNTPVSVILPDLGGCFGLFLEPITSGSSINGWVKRFT